LVEWLQVNVGKFDGFTYSLPMRGDGWIICEGHGEDDMIDDYGWRKLYPNYVPKGRFGFWLEIMDEEKAVLLKLSGLLDNRLRGHPDNEMSLDYEPPNRIQSYGS